MSAAHSDKPIVVKYGGMCLSTPEKIRTVAQDLAHRILAGERLVIVVSAMGKTTDQLIALAKSVSAVPNRRELDMLISTGERVSMALLSMALNEFLSVAGSEKRAVSLTGSQAAVLTTEVHSQARIVDIKPLRLNEVLARGDTVVLAGFQGVSATTKEITTLGRGGSDLTAVAVAVALGAQWCEIVKEVSGVMSDDPSVNPASRLLTQLNHKLLCSMTHWGAKVLHHRAADVAARNQMPLLVRKSGESSGTIVETRTLDNQSNSVRPERGTMFESTAAQPTATTRQSGVRKVSVSSNRAKTLPAALAELNRELNAAGITEIQIIWATLRSLETKDALSGRSATSNSVFEFFIWAEKDLVEAACQHLKQTQSTLQWAVSEDVFQTTSFHFETLLTMSAIASASAAFEAQSQAPSQIIATLTGAHTVTFLWS